MGLYNIPIQGSTVTVRVVDNPDVVYTGVCELRSQIGTKTAVGLVVKHDKLGKAAMLQLCAGTRCLVLLLNHFDYKVTQYLMDFLSNLEYCFVGVGLSKSLLSLRRDCNIEKTRGIELSELASKILKKPHLCECGMDVIAAVVGIGREESPTFIPYTDWSAMVFSYEQIKYAIQDVYAAHQIGTKLLSML